LIVDWHWIVFPIISHQSPVHQSSIISQQSSINNPNNPNNQKSIGLSIEVLIRLGYQGNPDFFKKDPDFFKKDPDFFKKRP